MQKPRDSFANHLSVNLQAQKPHRHPWDNHHSSGSDTAAEEGDLAVMDVALRPLLSSTATTATPSSTPPGHSSSTARLTRPIGTTAFNNYRQHLKKRGPYEVHCEVLDNRQGKIIVDGALTIYCSQLQSANGMIAATGPIHIVCHEFCNSNGVVQSHVGTITITSRYALCNQQGQLLAQSDVTLTNPHARFDNSQGSIISKGSLHITGDTLTNQGQITGETIGMTLKEQLINGPVGAIQAAKKLDVITGHNCRNEGQIQAVQQIKLQAPVIENHPKGVIEAKQTQLLTSNPGECINQGLIDGQMTAIRANKLSNLEGGRLYGDEVLLATETLVNQPKKSDHKPMIAARQQLTIGAQKIVNREGALIISHGSMTVGGQLDEQQRLNGTSALLDNLSATIDVQGEAHFQVATVNNRDIFFSTQSVAISSTRYRQMQRDGDTVRVPINDETLRNFTDARYTVYDYHRTVSETVIQRQSPAQLLVGQNLSLTGILTNDKSQVIVGGQLSGSMKSINHIDAFGNRVTTEQGTTQFTYTDWVRDNGLGTTQFKRIWQSPVSHQKEVENSRYLLKIAVEQQNQGPLSSSYSIAQWTKTALDSSKKSAVLTLSLPPLFRINRDNPQQPLVSSDPRLFNYRGALGISALVNPSLPLPSLCGDVGYAQYLIREQLITLTGHCLFPGYRNDAEQYFALLNQGAETAKVLDLIPGHALTAEQQQCLTIDIIWPVQQPITLETGEVTEELIPKLYPRHKLLRPQGTALITANEIELSLTEKLNSSGILQARNQCQIAANAVDNQGQITGEHINLALKEQLINGEAAAIQAAKKLEVIAGDDCRNEGDLLAGQQLHLMVKTHLKNRGTIAAQEVDCQAHSISNWFKDKASGAAILKAEKCLTVSDCYEYYNEGQVQAGEKILLHARTIHNHKDGKIQAPTMDLIGGTEKRDDGSLWSGGDVTNHGSIELRSGLMRARTVFNGSNGQVYADDLRIEATYFYNDSQKQEPEEVQERDTLLIARQRLTIGASRIIINRDQALLYSGGDLSIGKTLDDQQQAVGPAKVFNNLSATIDVQGNMQLNAEESNHEDIHFSTHLVEVSRSSGGHRCGSTYYGYDTIVSETRIATHEPAKLLVGGTLTINGEHFYNRQSQVIYGVKLQGSLQGLENIDGEGKRVTERRGHSVLDTRCGLFGLVHIHREGPYYTYKDHPISLGVVIEKQGSKPDSPGGQLARRTTDFSVCALQIIHRQVDGVSVRMMTLDRLPTLPTSGLFSINGQNPQGPLIQTDPRLFSYPGRVDDFTSALIVNPSPQLPPWLGDTFYLQQLVRQQVQQLTGQRFLAGFRHDTEQCLALVLRGKELAQQPGFKIGKQLTAEQMQQLQQSVIWPIRQSFTLADGSQRWVVIPQLYAVITDTEVPSAVAMIHGHQMELQLSGKLINSGSLRTVNTLAVKAQRISNQGIIFGDRVQIQAEQDVDHQGKLLGAKQLLHVKAGVDFVAATRSHSSQVKDNRGHYSANQTVLGERSRMLVTEAGGQLLVEAGRDINLAAAQILNSGPDGSSQFISGRDINLQTVEVEQREHYQGAGEHYQGQGEQRDIGSQIKTAGNLRFQAKGQFTATAAQVASGIPINNALAALEAEGCASDSLNPVSSGRLQIQASSIALLPGRASRYREKSTQHTDKKLLNSTTRTDYQFQQQATILGCEFSGSHTELVATEGDLVVHGSKVASDHGTSLLAEQGNISITSAESHHQQITAHQEEKSGLFSEGGVSLTLGEQQHRQRQQLNGREQHSSAIGSRFGDVKIWAKQHYQQLGSHLVAPHGEVDASGATLEVKDTHQRQQLAQESHSHTSGLTIGATNPALSAWQTANQLTSTASQTSDPRMQALAAVTGGLAAKNLSDAIKTNPSQLGGVNFSVTVGESESHSHSQEQQTQAQRSQVIGRNLTVQARDGNATLQGDFQAAEQLQLSAAKDLQLLASQSQSHQQSHQSSSSHSFGVGLGSSGNGITTSLSVGKGHRQGDSTHYQLTQVSAGQKVILQSGGDTQIQGVIEARQIQGQARNLTVESLQDTDYQQGQQQQLGVSLTAGANSISGSINLNNNHYRSDYASVQQRAGLESADGGIQYRVEKNLHLSGAVMAGNEEAVKHDRIQIVAGTVTQKAIENRDDNNASSVGLGIGFSQSKNQPPTGVGKNQLGQATTGALQVPGSQLPSQHGLSATMPVVMNAGHSASSTTYSGISNAAQAVTITNPAAQLALTGQTPEQAIATLKGSVISGQDGSNAIKPIFNQQEIEAGFQIVGALTREVGTFLENRTRTVTEAQQALKQEQAKPLTQQDSQRIQQLQQSLHDNRHWEMGGNGRLLMTAFTQAIGGNVTGSASQLLQSTVVNTLQGLGAQQIKRLADSLNSETARTALQGLLAGTGAAIQGQNVIPAALGASGSVVLNNLFEAAYSESSQDLTLDERQARRNLVTSIISGTTQALGGDAALANTAAAIEMENNYLSQAQYNQKKQALSECESFIQNAGIQAKWDLINIGQEASFAAGMIAGVPASLYEAVEAIANAAVTPRETYLSLKALFNSDNILGTVSEAVKQSYIARIDKMNEEYEKAGFTCAFNAGAEGTKLIADIASLVATGVGVAKGAVSLTDFGIKLSKQGLNATKTGNLAKRAATLAANTLEVGCSAEVAQKLPKMPEKAVITSRGAENIASYPKLKNQLKKENLSNIAKHDFRLDAILKGGSNKNPNFSIGSGTRAEADKLGRIWVGEGARPMSGVQGALVSADGTRTYRPPISKNSPFATTGLQANFQQFDNGKMISNGHLNITQ